MGGTFSDLTTRQIHEAINTAENYIFIKIKEAEKYRDQYKYMTLIKLIAIKNNTYQTECGDKTDHTAYIKSYCGEYYEYRCESSNIKPEWLTMSYHFEPNCVQSLICTNSCVHIPLYLLLTSPYDLIKKINEKLFDSHIYLNGYELMLQFH